MKNKKQKKVKRLFRDRHPVIFVMIIIGSIMILIYLATLTGDYTKGYNPEIHDLIAKQSFVEDTNQPISEYKDKNDWCERHRPINWDYCKKIKKSKCKLNPNDSENCVCDEYERKEIQVKSGVILIPVFETTYNSESYDKIRVPNFNLINYTTKIIQDCGDYHCKFINITIMTAYQETDVYQIEYKETGNCISAHKPQKPIKINLEKEKCVEHTDDEIHLTKTTYVTCKDVIDEISKGNYVTYTYDLYCCLKKEDKNPCELGKKGFIEVLTRFGNVHTAKLNECLSGIDADGFCKICREMTEQELNQQHCNNNEKGWVEDYTWIDIRLSEKERLFFAAKDCNGRICCEDEPCSEEGWERVKICRQKKIQDYSCEELNLIVELELRYCENRNKLGAKYCIGFRAMMEPEEIYNIAIEKKCKI